MEAVADADAALVTRCKADDRQAFDEIVARYRDRILNYVLNMVDLREDAEDIAQETFVKAFAGLRSFESRSTLHTWLFRIATNLCIDYRRRCGKAERRPLSLDSVGMAECVPPTSGANTRRGDPVVSAADAEMAGVLRRAIAGLPDRLRTVVLLHDVEGLAYQEIAAVVRCPLGTVKSRLFHARLALRRSIGPYLRGDEPAPARPARQPE